MIRSLIAPDKRRIMGIYRPHILAHDHRKRYLSAGMAAFEPISRHSECFQSPDMPLNPPVVIGDTISFLEVQGTT